MREYANTPVELWEGNLSHQPLELEDRKRSRVGEMASLIAAERSDVMGVVNVSPKRIGKMGCWGQRLEYFNSEVDLFLVVTGPNRQWPWQ